mgnify:CR=1 FL=1
MTHHYWGDGFDFDRLKEAGKQIENIYHELTGESLIWKEKYGTLRYQWFHNKEDAKVDGNVKGAGIRPVDLTNKDFLFAIMITVHDYPDLVSEILSDFLFHDKWEDINKFRKGPTEE